MLLAVGAKSLWLVCGRDGLALESRDRCLLRSCQGKKSNHGLGTRRQLSLSLTQVADLFLQRKEEIDPAFSPVAYHVDRLIRLSRNDAKRIGM